MPDLDKDAERLLALAREIEATEQELALVEMRLEDLRLEFTKAARAYGARTPVEVHEPLFDPDDAPWADPELSAPDRVREYFRYRPHAKVTAADLVEAGIDVKIENLRSTLHRMAKGGELSREGTGVYTLAKPEPGEADS